MMNKSIPRNKMVRKNRTLADLGTIRTDYPIEVRVKEFEVIHADGKVFRRGPCISLQQFNPDGHFLAAISFDLDETGKFKKGLLNCLKTLPLWGFLEEKMQSISVNQAEDIQKFIERARKVFGPDKEFTFAIWPDGSLKLIVKRKRVEVEKKS